MLKKKKKIEKKKVGPIIQRLDTHDIISFSTHIMW